MREIFASPGQFQTEFLTLKAMLAKNTAKYFIVKFRKSHVMFHLEMHICLLACLMVISGSQEDEKSEMSPVL